VDVGTCEAFLPFGGYVKNLCLVALVLAGASALMSAPFETSCRIEQSSSGSVSVVYQGGPSDPDCSDYHPGVSIRLAADNGTPISHIGGESHPSDPDWYPPYSIYGSIQLDYVGNVYLNEEREESEPWFILYPVLTFKGGVFAQDLVMTVPGEGYGRLIGFAGEFYGCSAQWVSICAMPNFTFPIFKLGEEAVVATVTFGIAEGAEISRSGGSIAGTGNYRARLEQVPEPIPEPAALLLTGSGLLAAFVRHRARTRKA
jgi:hypothetical protein